MIIAIEIAMIPHNPICIKKLNRRASHASFSPSPTASLSFSIGAMVSSVLTGGGGCSVPGWVGLCGGVGSGCLWK